MNDPATAPHNRHFWGLHGWIDESFARWQRAHGEAVDQSPISPHVSEHGHLAPPAPLGGVHDMAAGDQAARAVMNELTRGTSQEEVSRIFKESIFIPVW
jgi:hypothetical protein